GSSAPRPATCNGAGEMGPLETAVRAIRYLGANGEFLRRKTARRLGPNEHPVYHRFGENRMKGFCYSIMILLVAAGIGLVADGVRLLRAAEFIDKPPVEEPSMVSPSGDYH